MKLYYSPGACSLVVHIALRERGLPFVAVPVDLVKHQLEDGSNYYDISPRGYSVADAYAFAVLNWVNFLSIPIASFPSLRAYLTRVSSRPAVQAALRAEGLLR